MNWIKFYGFDKIQILEDFKYIGPLKRCERENMWANFSYHSIKIKCPNEIYLIGLKGRLFKDVLIKKDGQFYDAKFKIHSVRGLSDNRDHKIIKLELEDLNLDLIESKEVQRELKLSDLFEL